jgi:hypothetical protein
VGHEFCQVEPCPATPKTLEVLLLNNMIYVNVVLDKTDKFSFRHPGGVEVWGGAKTIENFLVLFVRDVMEDRFIPVSATWRCR